MKKFKKTEPLGTKSAFSYTKNFHFITRKDGIERKYLLYKSELGFNIDLLFEKVTNEKNGVTVIIPIIHGDFWKFQNAIKNQLCYFDNVFFDVAGTNLNKDFQIFTQGSCQRSTLRNDSEVHICLGRVCYPIDWKMLGINRILLPIGLKFSLDSGIFPTPNRESIIWNSNTCKMVKDRIVEVSRSLINKYNDSVKEFDNLYEAYSYIDGYSKNISFLGTNLDIRELNVFGVFNDAKIKGVKLKNASFYKRLIEYMTYDYRFVAKIEYNTIKTKRLYGYRFNSSYIIEKKEKIALINEDDKISGYFALFLKTKDYKYIVKPVLPVDKKNKNHTYYEMILGVNYTKDQLDEYLRVKEAYLKAAIVDCTSLSSSKEFEDYKLDNKVKKKAIYVSKKLNKQQGEVVINESYKIKNRIGYAFAKKSINIENIKNLPYMLILVEEDDKFDDIYHHIYCLQKLRFFKIGKQDYKKLSKFKIHNIMKFKDLERTKAFSRVASIYYIDELLDKFQAIKSSASVLPVLQECFPKFKKLCLELESYKSRNYTNPTHNADFRKSIISVAKLNNYFDNTIIDKIKELEKFVDDFSFISYLRSPNGNDNIEYADLVYSLLIMKKTKFNKPSNIEIKIKN